MKKSITIILKKPFQQLGEPNTTCEVTLGYAFNYLIPKGIAEVATKGKMQHLETIKTLREQKLISAYSKNISIKKQIEKLSKISIRKKKGQNEQFFGSINENNLSKIIFEKTGYRINKKEISIPEIKNIGIFKALITLTKNIKINVQIQIIPKYI